MEMKSMMNSSEDVKEYGASSTMMSDAPKYPYGLRLDLDDKSLKKLGIKSLPSVGDKMMIQALVEVCCVSERQELDEDSAMNVGLQITDMAIADAPKESKSASETLYGSEA